MTDQMALFDNVSHVVPIWPTSRGPARDRAVAVNHQFDYYLVEFN